MSSSRRVEEVLLHLAADLLRNGAQGALRDLRGFRCLWRLRSEFADNVEVGPGGAHELCVEEMHGLIRLLCGNDGFVRGYVTLEDLPRLLERLARRQRHRRLP